MRALNQWSMPAKRGLFFESNRVHKWMSLDDKSTIRLPTAVFIALLGASTLGGGGAVGIISDRDNNELSALKDVLQSVRKDIEDVRAAAEAALTIAGQNGARVNDNRQSIQDSERNAWGSVAHEKYSREIDARFNQVERRLTAVEREIDKLQD